MTPHLDITPPSLRSPLYVAVIARIEEAYNSVMATDATFSKTGTLPGADGVDKVYRSAAPEMDTKNVRVLLPLVIAHSFASTSNGQFSTYDGDATDASITITSSSLDAATTGDISGAIYALLKSTMLWVIAGFTLHRIVVNDGDRVETRARWPRIYHVDQIYNLTLSTN